MPHLRHKLLEGMTAAEFFAAHYSGEISKQLQTLDEETQVAWEAESVHPDHSPGPVAHEERLCRPHVNPVHYEPGRQELKPTAFQDAATIGLSVDRLTHADIKHSLAKAQVRVQVQNTGATPGAPERSVYGYSIFDVSELRAVKVQGQGSKIPPRRGLGVYDTSLNGEAEHADVCFVAPNTHGGRSARLDLFRLGNATHQLLSKSSLA